MDPRRVLTFRAVAHRRSFSAAARALSLSQPSVSNQVAQLETQLGVRLLERRPGDVRLTREGEILLEHADAVADRFELAAEQLATAAAAQRAHLRISAFPTAVASLLPAAIAGVRSRHPEARVTVREAAGDAALAGLRTGELHVAVVFQDVAAPREEPPGTERRDLLRESFLVAMRPDHPLASEEAVHLADLAADDWTAAQTDGPIVRACRDAGFEPNLVSLTSDQLAIRGLVGRGLAVTLVPRLLAERFRDLALRPIAGGGPARDVYSLLPPGAKHPLAEPLLEELERVAADLES